MSLTVDLPSEAIGVPTPGLRTPAPKNAGAAQGSPRGGRTGADAQASVAPAPADEDESRLALLAMAVFAIALLLRRRSEWRR